MDSEAVIDADRINKRKSTCVNLVYTRRTKKPRVTTPVEAVLSSGIEPISNNVQTSSGITSKKVGSRKTFWDNSTHMTFVKVCLEEVRNGNRPRTHFNKKGWVNVRNKLKARTGKDFCKPQLKNHWDTMKKDWKIYDSLMRIESGLQLDPFRRTIDATPEWWDEKIKAHPEFAKFRDKNLQIYHMYYEELFRLRKNNDSPSNIRDESVAANIEGNGNRNRDESSLGDSVETESSIVKKKNKENNSNAHSKRRKTTGVSSSVELQAHNHVPRRPMSLLLQAALSSPSSQTIPPQTHVPSIADPSIADCMDIVATFPGFEPSSTRYNKALRLFWKKEARESFMYPPSVLDKINFLKSLLNE